MAVDVRPVRTESDHLPRVVGGREAAPREWQAWAEEPGQDLAAMAGGRPVGGIHVSIVGRTEAWLEALRVDPDAQGRGIAGRLIKEGEQLARRHGAAVLRAAIPAHDDGTRAVAERAGFKVITRAAVLEAEVREVPADIPHDALVETPRSDAVPALTAFLERTATLAAWARLVPLGWRFRRLLPELVRGLVKDRRAAAALPAGRGEMPQAAALFGFHEEAVVVSVLDGTPPGMQALFGEIAESAQGHGLTRVVVFTHDREALRHLDVRVWQPHPWCPDGLVIAEKRIAS